MINASQYSFDYETLDTYNGASIEDIVENTLNELGYYVLGCMDGIEEIDWASGYDADVVDYSRMHQCGVDYFRTPYVTEDFEPLLEKRLAEVGCQFWAAQGESVDYDDSIIKYVARWYKEPVEQVVDNLVNAGYIDEYDRDYYLAE